MCDAPFAFALPWSFSHGSDLLWSHFIFRPEYALLMVEERIGKQEPFGEELFPSGGFSVLSDIFVPYMS